MPVCRAIATTKMHYLPKNQEWLRQQAGATHPLEGHRFDLAYPDLTPASGGTRAMTEASWRVLEAEMQVKDAADYVKPILNKHDEAAAVDGF